MHEQDLRLPLLIIPAAFLTYNFIKLFTCGGVSSLSCNVADFVVVFPFYAMITSFVGRLDSFEYIVLYIFCAAVYLGIFYHLTGWFLEVFKVPKNQERSPDGHRDEHGFLG